MYKVMVLDQITPDELDKIIHGLKNSAVGHDDVDAGHLKAAYQFIKIPLLYICNQSYLQGIFASDLKIARVIPLFKTGDSIKVNNYRPVFILPVLSEVLERLMYNSLIIVWINRTFSMNTFYCFTEHKIQHRGFSWLFLSQIIAN